MGDNWTDGFFFSSAVNDHHSISFNFLLFLPRRLSEISGQPPSSRRSPHQPLLSSLLTSASRRLQRLSAAAGLCCVR